MPARSPTEKPRRGSMFFAGGRLMVGKAPGQLTQWAAKWCSKVAPLVR
nr:hypothetical protein [Tanacetum cinerariifolium]